MVACLVRLTSIDGARAVNAWGTIAAARTYGRYPIAADLSRVPFQLPTFPAFDEWLKGKPEEVIRRARKG